MFDCCTRHIVYQHILKCRFGPPSLSPFLPCFNFTPGRDPLSPPFLLGEAARAFKSHDIPCIYTQLKGRNLVPENFNIVSSTAGETDLEGKPMHRILHTAGADAAYLGA